MNMLDGRDKKKKKNHHLSIHYLREVKNEMK